MTVIVTADDQGGWVVKEQDLAMFSRVLNGEIGHLLLNSQGIIAQGAEDLAGLETKGTFLFECLLQTFMAVATGVKARLRGTRIEAVRDALRRLSERAFTVTLTHSPQCVVGESGTTRSPCGFRDAYNPRRRGQNLGPSSGASDP